MKPWQKIGLGVGAILVIISIAQANNQSVKTSSRIPTYSSSTAIQQENKLQDKPQLQAPQTYEKSNYRTSPQPVKTYINSRGNTVQSPTYYPAQPSGASARCYDGTYSFSQSRRGTCSHHGGVEEWL